MSAIVLRVVLVTGLLLLAACANPGATKPDKTQPAAREVHLGPRPHYLVDQLEEGALKDRLQTCTGPYRPSDFSIGHRGAPMQFPEHTRESYTAAARMGAGLIECDVTFTRDAQLVCRHDECDLHDTTNILLTDLAERCEIPFTPATFDASTGELQTPATARCCSSALTLDDFKSLKGKMDGNNPLATDVEDYLAGTPGFRTDGYASGGTLMSHVENVALLESLGVKHIPELKAGRTETVNAVFGSQANYAQKMIENYKNAGVSPDRVWVQSFQVNDVLYWLKSEPLFGQQAVLLISNSATRGDTETQLKNLATAGVRIVAPPIQRLLTVDANSRIIPSNDAIAVKQAGLEIMAWTLERSGRIREDVLLAREANYYQSVLPALSNDGDILKVLDVLAKDVGVKGVFSDWPATTTFYANCSGL